MGKLLEDKEARKRLINDIVNLFNNNPMIEENERVKEEDINALFNDETRIQKFLQAREIIDKRVKKEKLCAELEKAHEGEDKFQPLSRIVEYSIDISGTEEANKHNNELLEIYHDTDKAIDYTNKLLKNIVNADPMVMFYSSDEECFEKMKNDDGYLESFFLIDDLTHTYSTCSLNPVLDEALTEKKTIFQQASKMRANLHKMASPLYFLLPDKMLQTEKIPLIAGELNKLLSKPENKELLEEFEIPSKKLNNDIMNCGNYLSGGYYEFQQKPVNDFIMENFANGKLSKNFLSEQCFTLNGKRTPTKTIFQKLAENTIKKEDIDIMPIPFSNKKEIQDHMTGDYMINFGKFKSEFDAKIAGLKQAKEDLTATLGFFTRDSKQFKNMRSMLNEIVDKCEEFTKDPKNADPRKVTAFSLKLENNLNILATVANSYLDKKAQDKIKFDKKGKKFNERTENRLAATNRLMDTISKNLFIPKKAEENVNDINDNIVILKDESLGKDLVKTEEKAKENEINIVSEQIEISTDINKNNPNINGKSK